jgi:putative FmdB family regulatory protein
VPIYEYQCAKCGHRFERMRQKFSDPPAKKCPQCGGRVQQLMSAPAVQFKGSGWYATDYARKSGPSAESGDGTAPETKKTEEKETTAPAEKESKKEKGKRKK